MTWRLVGFEYWDAYMNMAIDEAVSEAVGQGRSPPTIRFYGWSPSAVSIGCFQSIHDEVDLEECRRRGIDVVRRRTGGGAVYHDRDGEITYSVISPESMMDADINKAYRAICGWITRALGALGISATFVPINDIVVDGKKVSGSAQTRRGGMFLQHGTLLYGVDPSKMFSILKVGRTKISDKDIASVEARVTSISRLLSVPKDRVLNEMIRSFTEDKDCKHGRWTQEELDRARELASARYATREWNLRR